MNKAGTQNLLKFFFYVYIISTGFNAVFRFPYVGLKIQPAEFVFLVLFILWIVYFRANIIRLISFNKLEFAFVLYLGIEIVSAFNANTLFSWLEVVATAYLITVYYVSKIILLEIKISLTELTLVITITGVIAALFGIIGWVLAQFQIETTLAGPLSENYPYFGHISRAEGMLNSPNMLHNLLGLCFLVAFNSFLQSKKKNFFEHLSIAILIIGIVVCFSKTTLLLLIAVIYLLIQHYRYSRPVRQLLITGCVVVFGVLMIGTHYMVLNKSSSLWEKRYRQTFFDPNPVWDSERFVIVPTSYAVLRKSAIQAGLENPIFGYGPGSHKFYVKELKKKDQYPKHIINYDPHSLFLGPFAELGVPGFLAVIWIFICIWQMLIKSVRHRNINSYFNHSLVAALLFMTLDGINMDILHFRHLWILFAILVFGYYNENGMNTSSTLNINKPLTV